MSNLDYSVAMQELFVGMMIAEPQLYIRVSNILNPENFDKTLRPAAEFIKEFSEAHSSLPDLNMVKAKTGVEIQPVGSVDSTYVEWFLDEFEKFTRRQELERAIMKSADLLEKGEYEPVEGLIKAAVQISITKDMGTDYFADPQHRLEAIRNNRGQVSTGWPVLDNKLYGGFNRGELQIFAGGSGSGKSLFMQNLAVNWVTDINRYNGVYISLELSEELCSSRIDAMMTDTQSSKVLSNIGDVALKVKMKARSSGKLYIKYMPAQSNVNDIRAYIKSLEIETGIKVDFMCVDYLDLLMPVSAKVSPSDLFIKDKYVSEELRNLAKELRVVLVTASQLNRAAVEEVEFDHSHISGGISKINTADNVFGIFTSRAMKERGQYQIQLMKTRSSSGVGQKIDLSYNNDTLRIYDDGDSTGMASAGEATSQYLNKLRATSTVKPADTTYNEALGEAAEKVYQQQNSPFVDSETGEIESPTGKIRADMGSTKMKEMLNRIKGGKSI